MPKIIIREKDNTLNPTSIEENFTVVVPGFWQEIESRTNPFDDYDVCMLEDTTDFIEKIGFVPAFELFGVATSSGTIDIKKHYGNQIAYELLRLGYKVLYVNIGGIVTSINEETGEVTPTPTTDTVSKYLRFVRSDSDLFEPLKDKATYNFRFLLTGSLSQDVLAAANPLIMDVANVESEKAADKLSGRGDCIALLDIPEEAVNPNTSLSYLTPSYRINSIRDATAETTNSKYAAWFCPAVNLGGLHSLSQYADNTLLPASFYYLACFAKAREKNFAEWYAAAGLTRGVSDFTVIGTTANLGETAINALQPRKPVSYNSVKYGSEIDFITSINIIAKIHGHYYLWGNRTAETLTEDDLIASHFLNIRQLCTTLKKNIYEVCKKCTFDPNSDLLWINFCNALRPGLESMKADQGIADYEFIQLESKRAELKALIRIVPIEAVEDFDITVSLEDSLESMTISEE